MAVFERGEPLERAAMLTNMPDEIFRQAIVQAKNRLLTAQKYFHEIKDPNEADIEILIDVSKIAKDLVTLLKASLDEKQEE